jgi:hypothetical protein
LALLNEYMSDLRELQSVDFATYVENRLGILKRQLGDLDEYARAIVAYLASSLEG